MPGIEWLDDSGDVLPADRVSDAPAPTAGVPTAGAHRPSDPDAPTRAWGIAAVVLWALAAAGSAYASFGALYRVHFAGGTLSDSTVDGWGHLPKDAAAVSGVHGARYGIALCAVAAVLLVVALASLVAAVRPRIGVRLLRITPAIGLAAAGTLIGILVAAALEAQAELAAVRAALRLEALDTADHTGSTRNAQLHYGSLLGFGAAATACAVLALLAPPISRLVTRRIRRRRALLRSVGPATTPAGHPDDEALTSGPGRRFPPVAG